MDKIINELKKEITDSNELLEMVCNQNMTLSKDMIDLKLKTLILNKQIDMLIEEMQELKNKISK
jgi:predicted  nucleic acid-binding Zn-ribbon protein